MLKVRLSPPIYSNRSYHVFLDSGLRKTFTNKRAAEDHIRFIEQEFNQAILFVNEEFAAVNEFYRIYFIADRDMKFKYSVENCLQFIDNRLNYISVHTQSENLNTMMHQAINNCFDELLSACNLIYSKAVQRYDCLTRNRILLKIRIIENYKAAFLDAQIAIYKNKVILKAV